MRYREGVRVVPVTSGISAGMTAVRVSTENSSFQSYPDTSTDIMDLYKRCRAIFLYPERYIAEGKKIEDVYAEVMGFPCTPE